MIIMRSKTLTSQKCKLCYQCFFRKIGDNYARDDKLCQHNLSKPKRRSATRSELYPRLSFSDFPWPGHQRQICEMLVIAVFPGFFESFWCKNGAETQVCRRRDVDRPLVRVLDHIYRVIYASFARFRVFFKTERFFSISFFRKKANSNVAYLNRFHTA